MELISRPSKPSWAMPVQPRRRCMPRLRRRGNESSIGNIWCNEPPQGGFNFEEVVLLSVTMPEVINEKVNRLREDFDKHVDDNEKQFSEIGQKLDSIIKEYANRLPVWATLFISVLTALLGMLATLAAIKAGG